jgi:hypothetical protein
MWGLFYYFVVSCMKKTSIAIFVQNCVWFLKVFYKVRIHYFL